MKKSNSVFPFLEPDESLRKHIEILGIDFSVDEWIPVTDVLLKILQSEAEGSIRRPVLAAACDGKISYSVAFPEEMQEIPPEQRRKVVISGIETELLAVLYDDTPVPHTGACGAGVQRDLAAQCPCRVSCG